MRTFGANGARLTSYGGDASDPPPHVLQEHLDAVAAGRAVVPVDRVFALDDIVEVSRVMAEGRGTGKLVVVTRPADRRQSRRA